MTSTCIHNPHITFSPEKLFPTFTSSPSRPADMHVSTASPEKLSDLPEESDPDVSGDFEFRLDEPVNMLPADQLFSDGKLFPFIHPESTSISSAVTESSDVSGTGSVSVTSTDTPEFNPVINGSGVSVVDSFMYSPKAPKCSSKWKELLGLRKLYQNSNNSKQCNNVTTSSPSPSSSIGNGSTAIRSIKQFLSRTSKSSTDSSINLPLLNDVTNDNESSEPTEPPEPASLQSRHSLSSSSSGHDPDDVNRLSLDSEKQLKVNMNLNTNTNTNVNTNPNNPVRMKLVKTRTLSTDGSILGVSIESPRMNSSGKIVFHSLERSSSSPSSFNGGNRLKHRGMERSYSGNVRITPVLNVPVCSLRGFPLFSSSQKHEAGSSNNNNNKGASRNQQMMNNNNNKSKSDRS
ncbi:hypothetical protein QVD17_38506 [Tagetes erecta]|uniref:Uncharacterized protein n=1 Tax=Tagetes erecta TaxID=13708 RepID=A0AAD8JLY2_TARER|nr:hypothetical protein QVD17_38506 [Tagetes erecta]